MSRDPLGDLLEALCSEAACELVLCAPFAKARVVDRLLARISAPSIAPLLITRWRPEEVAAGVSDLSVLDIVQERGGRVVLHNDLHAKYFRNEARVLLGSANLTSTALGWCWPCNLELLTPVPGAAVRGLESRLLAEGVVADQDLAAEIALLALDLDVPMHPESQASVLPTPHLWVPALRYPQDLYEAYAKGLHELSAASATAAASDLLALDLPTGLEADNFRRAVGERLWNSPLTDHIKPLLARPQRFGALSKAVGTRLGLPSAEADVVWQALMRWLLVFCSDRVERRGSRWSEMLVLR